MKTVSSALHGHLSADCTTLARLYKITRNDGTVLTYTDHDRDIDTTTHQGTYLTDGGYVYEAAVGFSPTAVQNKSDLSVDNQEVTAFIDSVTIKETELRYGVWDSAAVEIRVVNWNDLTQGEIKLRKGTLGAVNMKDGVLTAEILGLTNKLQVLVGRTYGTVCDAELGDERCNATVTPETGYVNTSPDAHNIMPHAGGSPLTSLTGAAGHFASVTSGTFVVANASGVTNSGQTGTGTIATPSGTMTITDANTDGTDTTYTFIMTGGAPPAVAASVVITGMVSGGNNGTFSILSVADQTGAEWLSGYYDDGILTFTSGVNSGLSFQIDRWNGTTLRLKNALFSAPALNDTFTISPGCAHNVTDCKNKFNNLANHRGFPAIPGLDAIFSYPNATG